MIRLEILTQKNLITKYKNNMQSTIKTLHEKYQPLALDIDLLYPTISGFHSKIDQTEYQVYENKFLQFEVESKNGDAEVKKLYFEMLDFKLQQYRFSVKHLLKLLSPFAEEISPTTFKLKFGDYHPYIFHCNEELSHIQIYASLSRFDLHKGDTLYFKTTTMEYNLNIQGVREQLYKEICSFIEDAEKIETIKQLLGNHRLKCFIKLEKNY